LRGPNDGAAFRGFPPFGRLQVFSTKVNAGALPTLSLARPQEGCHHKKGGIMKKYKLIGIILLVLHNMAYGWDFRNLQWKDRASEITEACIDDKVVISFDAYGAAEGQKIEIEIWENTDGKLTDLIKSVTGTVNNGKVELAWTVEFDMENKETNYYREIEKKGFTILDYVFVMDYKDVKYMSKLLAVTAWGDTLVTDKNTGEPMRNREYILMLLTPDREDREYISGKTDNNGRIKQHNLRKIGSWKIII
jgi:hypothetical protein